MTTAREQLEQCENAISIILRGGVASYMEAGKTFQNLSLKDLYDIRDRLKGEIYAEENGIYRPIVRGNP